MKFSFLLTLALASVVLAIKRDTNADRMRRGLTPMRPRTGTPTLASRGSPSAVPTYCSSIYTTAVPIEILDMSNNVKGYMGQKTQDGYNRYYDSYFPTFYTSASSPRSGNLFKAVHRNQYDSITIVNGKSLPGGHAGTSWCATVNQYFDGGWAQDLTSYIESNSVPQNYLSNWQCNQEGDITQQNNYVIDSEGFITFWWRQGTYSGPSGDLIAVPYYNDAVARVAWYWADVDPSHIPAGWTQGKMRMSCTPNVVVY